MEGNYSKSQFLEKFCQTPSLRFLKSQFIKRSYHELALHVIKALERLQGWI